MEGKVLSPEQRIVSRLADGLDAGDPVIRQRFSTLALHVFLMQDRGITQADLALELGVSLSTVQRYIRIGAPIVCLPQSPWCLTQDRVDDAITAIWEARSGREYPRAMWTAGPLLGDGLPELIEYLDPEPLEYISEAQIKELMSNDTPGRRATIRGRRPGESLGWGYS